MEIVSGILIVSACV